MKKAIKTASTLFLLMSIKAHAALPTYVPPTSNPDQNNILAVFKGYLKDGTMIIGLLLSIAGTLWTGWNVLSDVNAARTGRKEWGEVGLTSIVSCVAFLLVGYLIARAGDYF